MYDWPEVQWANDALWAAVAARLREAGMDAPAELDRERPSEEVWLDRELLLSQTCGWPYATRLIDRVRLVATPVYSADGCRGAAYSSFIIARRGEGGSLADFHGRRIATNSRDSLSGFVALRHALAGAAPGLAEAAHWIETGSHRASLQAVAGGEADLAALDAVCWAFATRHEREAVRLVTVVNRTELRPSLPLITGGTRSDAEVGLIRAALLNAIADPETRPAREALLLDGMAVPEEHAYAAIATLGRDAQPPKDDRRASKG